MAPTEATQATLRCDHQNRTLTYMHVWKSAGYSLMENLHSVGSGYEVTVWVLSDVGYGGL